MSPGKQKSPGWETLVVFLGFPCGSAGKESPCNAGDLGSISGLRRSPGLRKERLPTPLFWPGKFVAKSRTWLSDFHFTSLLRSTGNSDPTSPWIPSIWLNASAIPLTTLSSQQPWTVWETQQLHFLYPAIPSLHTCCLRMGRISSPRPLSLPSTPQCTTQGLIWGFLLTLPHRLSPLPPWVLKVCRFGGSGAEENGKTEVNDFWEKERKNSFQFDTSFIGSYWATWLKK